VPERLATDNLRVSERIKVLNPAGMDPDSAEPFFKAD
jgi:hypothetical protein